MNVGYGCPGFGISLDRGILYFWDTKRLQTVADEDTDYFGGQCLGPLAYLVPVQVLDGMLGENRGVVGCAPHLGHSLSRGDEPVGANGGRRDACVLYVNSVVHTARAAGASITHPYNDRVAVLRQLLDGLGHRGPRSAGLAVPADVGNLVAGAQHLD